MIALICGGVASGKSELAERLAIAVNQGKMAYLATMSPSVPEGEMRIRKHKTMRMGKGFETLEIPTGLSEQIDRCKGYDTVLLECMSNLVVNEMYLERQTPRETIEVVLRGLNLMLPEVKNIIVVSGAVFSGLTAFDEFTYQYIETLGKLNGYLANQADIVIETVCAIPVVYKGQKELARYESIF